MTTSEQINEIATALAKAQAGMKNAALNKMNPHFRSKYADLAGIRDAVIPALAANGIAASQTLVPFDGRVAIATRLLHSSGQWIESLCPLPDVADMQKMGSAITYARRYSLSAICGIAADEDDDANATTAPASPARVPQSVQPLIPDFEDFLIDMTAKADEGLPALTKAFNEAKPEYRRALTGSEKWDELKARASRKREAVTR